MPKGEKGPTTAKSVYVKFTEDTDLALYEELAAEAKAQRRDLGDHILLTLLNSAKC